MYIDFFVYLPDKEILTMTMFRQILLTMAAVLVAAVGCDKNTQPTDSPKPERTNFFVYDGYSFDINSVVRFDKGDNSVELWLSPESGLTTSEAIEKAGDFVVVNTNVSYLGGKDRFSGQPSKSSFLRYGNNLEFTYGKEGIAYIELSMTDTELTLSFMSEKLYTRSAAETSVMLQGSYSGKYITEIELPYSNEWGFDKERKALAKAHYQTYEDDSFSTFTLYDEAGSPAVELSVNPSKVGKKINLTGTSTAQDVKIRYNNGQKYNLTNTVGTIETSFEGETAYINVDLNNDGRKFRAHYSGQYTSRYVKLNRFIYEYGGADETSYYEGRHEVVKLMTKRSGDSQTFYFSPSESYTINTANSTIMPVLTVPTSIINAGKKAFTEISGWYLAFDLMQVSPFESEYKPHPDEKDWIEIRYANDKYEIDLELSGIATGMPVTHLDANFIGKAE